LPQALRAGRASIDIDGELVEIGLDDVIITETPRQGWAVASDDGASCALDLTLDEGLRAAGTLRDVIRAVQEARKQAGLEVTDRIALTWWSDRESTVQALIGGSEVLASEVLATRVEQAGTKPEAGTEAVDLGLVFELRKDSA